MDGLVTQWKLYPNHWIKAESLAHTALPGEMQNVSAERDSELREHLPATALGPKLQTSQQQQRLCYKDLVILTRASETLQQRISKVSRPAWEAKTSHPPVLSLLSTGCCQHLKSGSH